jgi:hypothetical protein
LGDHEKCKACISKEGNREKDMFMDRRYQVLGNTFCNFLDTVPRSGARVRSHSWSHPSSLRVSEVSLKSPASEKGSAEDQSAQPAQLADGSQTTLIIRNIGNSLNQQELMNLWPAEEGYDIFYMPFSFKRKKNLGFAFMNMHDHKTAVAFKEQWNGEQIHPTSKGIEIDWAETQGFEAHMEIINSYPRKLLEVMEFEPVVISVKASSAGTQSTPEEFHSPCCVANHEWRLTTIISL